MESKAVSKYVRMSPRKLRRVAELIKGESVDRALNLLTLTPKAASTALFRTLKSAASNAIATEGSAKVKVEDLFVKEISIDVGPTWKRIRPASMGRAFMIRKRTSHISVVVAERKENTKIIEGKK
ncbi:MAG: 50S ribosomal protein L22 [Candidatus Zixiibacteriota bacterium]|nr:MAG: 50S ribosomal protein L22 [candidate division Zixibacteria bacterium]